MRTRHPVADVDVEVVRALAEAAATADGHPSLGDSVWRDLHEPGDDTGLFLAFDGDEPIGALHAMPRPAGLATVGVVVHPDHRVAGAGAALLEAAVEFLADLGARHVVLWAFGADERSDAFAAAEGFAPERELWEMRVPLPVDEQPAWPSGIATRPFVPGQDDAEWLAVNNRAFANDPDQGGWTEADLRQREAEAWFDPAGFLVAIDDRGMAGFCWTKTHPPAPPLEPVALGEIYVIGVDPDRQGTGLGRALVVGGLTSLQARGNPVGMLFVDGSNTPATTLYRALGFDVTRVDRAYGRDFA